MVGSIRLERSSMSSDTTGRTCGTTYGTFIHFCPCCQKMSAVRIPINAHHFATSAHEIFDVLNIDFVGPFPDESYVLVIIDAYS